MIPGDLPPDSSGDESDRSGGGLPRSLRLVLALLPSLYLVFGFVWWQVSRSEQPLWVTWPRPEPAGSVAAAQPQPSPLPTPTPTGGVMSVSAVAPIMSLTAYPTDQVNVRAEPSRESVRLATVTPDDAFELLEVVNGQAVEKDEARWAKVRSGNIVGYIYWPFVTWEGKSQRRAAGDERQGRDGPVMRGE